MPERDWTQMNLDLSDLKGPEQELPQKKAKKGDRKKEALGQTAIPEIIQNADYKDMPFPEETEKDIEEWNKTSRQQRKEKENHKRKSA